ncbi:MAG TPA: acetyl-CoA carboxylase biotin carboxyl carrier protein subunit [Candidatus Atribacteria bacterium]|jgi:biotin carboxyl carrier protein|nr:MAG: Biotin/lipoyl attachment domain-containing protein [Atribacteria bacterium 34_128]HAJ32321.1 acetyl-CoA carboxylase biotin carboxyl carrier protein subunit [Candidatus Atribacteria bacterium]
MRKFQIKVDGKVYEVEVEEVGGNESSTGTISAPQPVVTKVKEEPVSKKAAKPSSSPTPTKTPTAAVAGEEVVAPMPGKVLQLKVAEGDSVKEGDTLLILEAMKMENEIVANTSGNVKKINVSTNDMVDTGDVLLVIG